ncbi:MAG: DUF5317 domain-containing protein [Anaerolineae bacterium]
MILLYVLIPTAVIALLLGGDLAALGNVDIKGGWLALLAFGVQAALIIYSTNREPYLAVILLLTHATVVGVFIHNRYLPGFRLAALGLCLNVLVMTANGGWMPITPRAAHLVSGESAVQFAPGEHPPASKDIVLAREDTRLWFLSDIIYLGFPRRTVVSLGDIFLTGGIAYFLLITLLKHRTYDYVTTTH